ncbi:MAG: threonine/serine exporter family protein [Clostridia bacterium]|nr:threonine/serine exporter family protein [Clostridia bacterium]
MTLQDYLPCLYALLACAGFAVMFEIKKPMFILLASATGMVSWLVFLLLHDIGSEVARYFLATMVAALFAETFARLMKAPATIFLVIGIVPLVPGGGLYYAMDALIGGNYALFAERGLDTAAFAAAIAAGVSVVTSIVRMAMTGRMNRRERETKKEE